jgi:soluble lytic murein transglycosylase-like protein
MRSFTLTLALVVVAYPAFARNASRHLVRLPPVPPVYAPVEQWAPQPVLATPHFRHVHAPRMRAEPPSSLHAHASSLPNWSPIAPRDLDPRGAFAAMVSRHAQANGVPESLVHRVIMRESRYNPRAVSRGNYGLMQIRLQTARAMGYGGPASGLLDPETNLTYAVRYLAGAYRAAGGNANRSVSYYAGGYAAGGYAASRYAQARQNATSPYWVAQGANAPWNTPENRHQMF